MQESKPLHDEQRRRLMLLGAGAAVVGGWACASRRYVEQPSNDEYRAKRGEVVFSDGIVGFGYLTKELERTLGWEDPVALLGQSKTYLLTTGRRQFEQLRRFNGGSLGLVKDTKLLKLKDNTVWGRIAFSYASGGSLSKVDVSRLEDSGFEINDYESRRWLHVRGRVFPAIIKPADLDTAAPRPKALDFRAPAEEESTPGWPNHDFTAIGEKLRIMNRFDQFMGLPLFNIGSSS